MPLSNELTLHRSFRISINGRKLLRCKPFLYRSSGARLLVATITIPCSNRCVNNLLSIIASPMSTTWNKKCVQNAFDLGKITIFNHFAAHTEICYCWKCVANREMSSLPEIHRNKVAMSLCRSCQQLVWLDRTDSLYHCQQTDDFCFLPLSLHECVHERPS